MLQSLPACCAESIIAMIGVIPMPPAMNRYRGESTSAKWLRGPRTRTAAAFDEVLVDMA